MTALVMGASGFLGSHVVRQLRRRGDDVRVLIRSTSSTHALEDLLDDPALDVRHGDVHDADSVRRAMDGCDVVYYCVVDARPWVDADALFRTNVDGLRTVLDVAAGLPLNRFVFTSSVATLPLRRDRPAREDDGPHNWSRKGGAYVRSRVAAEELALSYAREGRVPAVAMCVANTYGPGDHLPTPHGRFLAAAARGRLPFYIRGTGAEIVGVEDAAQALLLAADRGRVGERYIVSERYLPTREVHDIAARAVGVPPVRWGVPLTVMKVAGAVSGVLARLRGRETRLTTTTVRLMHVWRPLDHGKAERELGWRSRPAERYLADAARFFTAPRPRKDAADAP
ncbi:NAD-dependent epimerase/dehydratase family protein [Actinomadura nitritigenes]|uniref:NAD-dependent epimerase/dehydratase family protein n=1 Tax=Actinomadura nitritigenes TaxID=134602 RepID=UPI003D8ED1A3